MPVIFANRSILAISIAHPPSLMSVAMYTRPNRDDGDQDLRRSGCGHREFGCHQQRVELVGTHLDRHERVCAGVIMTEPAGKAFALVDGEVELELVAAA
jgi:hypothetical protein